MKIFFLLVAFTALFLSLSSVTLAQTDLEKSLTKTKIELGYKIIIIASGIVVVVTLVTLLFKVKREKLKWLMFLAIVVPVAIATAYSAGSTVFLNIISETRGPVHWHADFEIWKCGEKIDLIDPTGLLNRVGDPIVHEHGDNRIHVEGVLVELREASLRNFFLKVGGFMDNELLVVPTNEGKTDLQSGDLCNGEEAELQVFLYKVRNPEDVKRWNYEQIKLENFADYVLSPFTTVPPGDCIIIELDKEKEKTDRICETYRIAIEKGELRGG